MQTHHTLSPLACVYYLISDRAIIGYQQIAIICFSLLELDK